MTSTARALVLQEEAERCFAERALGFWMYLMSDAIIFGLLFATYAVMLDGTAAGPRGHDLFDAKNTLVESMLLLVSSATFGFASLCLKLRRQRATLLWLAITFVLGAAFLIMEMVEFHRMLAQGAGPQRSGYLSAFFTLVGTHGLHVGLGLIWIGILSMQLILRGITPAGAARLARLALFWHFLDLIWVGIFSIVYLPGIYQ
jgi:cytochrome o ubiquinol oxidase subunit 3